MSNNPNKDKISIKFLIHLVGERPALWDKTSEAYKDRALKETSWREICTYITENYDRMPQKTKDEFTKMIMKKWTHIRDSWVKSMKYGYDEVTKLPPKPYVYHFDLKFMQRILKCKPRRYDFSVPKMDCSNYDSFDGDKDGTQNSIPYEETDDVEEDHEHHVEHLDNHEHGGNVKQEHYDHNSSIHIEENQPIEEEYDEDDWPLNEAHTPLIEIRREPQHIMARSSTKVEQQREQKPEVKKRNSIFKSSRNNDDTEDTDRKHQDYEPRPSMSFSTYNYLNENRHWNFFKGILPTVNALDEDHTLQFQAGIITLLQKLRSSQNQEQKSSKSSTKPSARKRKASDDGDFEWPIQMKASKRYSTRNAKNSSDPIGGDESDTNYSDNE